VGLDTGKPAQDLIAWYKIAGYRRVGEVHSKGTIYDSVVIEKDLSKPD
jgi:hypothetical protein